MKAGRKLHSNALARDQKPMVLAIFKLTVLKDIVTNLSFDVEDEFILFHPEYKRKKVFY